VVRIILKKAKNLPVGSFYQLSQVPELDGELCPVSIYKIQEDYLQNFETDYFFVNKEGNRFDSKSLQSAFKTDIQRFLTFLSNKSSYDDVKSKKLTFGSLRKSGMSLLAVSGNFLSHEICWFSRHSTKGRGFVNTTVLDSYGKSLFFEKMVSKYRNAMNSLFPPGNFPASASNPPYEIEEKRT